MDNTIEEQLQSLTAQVTLLKGDIIMLRNYIASVETGLTMTQNRVNTLSAGT